MFTRRELLLTFLLAATIRPAAPNAIADIGDLPGGFIATDNPIPLSPEVMEALRARASLREYRPSVHNSAPRGGAHFLKVLE
jgi:hypothetical protein